MKLIEKLAHAYVSTSRELDWAVMEANAYEAGFRAAREMSITFLKDTAEKCVFKVGLLDDAINYCRVHIKDIGEEEVG